MNLLEVIILFLLLACSFGTAIALQFLDNKK